MRVYYNELDKPTAKWLSALCAGCYLYPGHIDTRSIRDVRPDDVRGYDQCHFFAGIGGWPLALRLSGYEQLPCWTGSPPCQPFSTAGQQRGTGDKRHLLPVWLNIVCQSRPPVLFGEEVAEAIRHGWLDDLFDALEREGYTCGAAVLPACSVGAPHIRKRLFFGAIRVEHANLQYFRSARNKARIKNLGGSGQDGRMADAHNARSQGRTGVPERTNKQPTRAGSLESRPTSTRHNKWSGADWLGCRDGKFRPVEPGTQPLADGISARVGRLRGYGNAIVPQVAAIFIEEFLEAALKGPEA